MNKTTGSASTSAKTEKEGVQIKGKDVIYLNAPEVRLSEDTPLDTEAQDIAGAINELKKLSEGKGGDWQPPADWLEVPEPGAWEANFLIEPKQWLSFTLAFYGSESKYRDGCGNMTVDWGDGTVETYRGNTEFNGDGWPVWGPESERRPSEVTHAYAEPGQYVVKATVDKYCCFFGGVNDPGGGNHPNLLIAKLGENIRLNVTDTNDSYGDRFAYQLRLCWVKVKGSSDFQQGEFVYCRALERLDLTEPMTEIPYACFLQARIPQNFDFSKIKKIGNSGLEQAENLPHDLFLPECGEIGYNGISSTNVVSISAPKCLSLGNQAIYGNRYLKSFSAPLCGNAGNIAFYNCTALYSAEFSEDCVFGTNCFQYCYSLYPRPDGSTN